jgi:hypothetical protein
VTPKSERLIRLLFLIAGSGALVVLLGWRFAGGTLGFDYPSTVSDPAVAQATALSIGIAAQFVIVLIGLAPRRFRHLMWLAVAEKAAVVGFGAWVIGSGGSIALWVWPLIATDFVLGICFFLAWRAMR